jgi:hypothetical protein
MNWESVAVLNVIDLDSGALFRALLFMVDGVSGLHSLWEFIYQNLPTV